MNTLELTLQRKTDSGYPVAASLTRPGGFLPLRREGTLNLETAALAELQFDPLAYGTVLGQALFVDEIRDTFREGLAGGEPLRVLLSIEAPDLRVLDWHRLAAPFDGRWRCLASQQNTPFSLSIPSPASAHFPALGRRDLRALVLVAGPELLASKLGLSSFDVPATIASIKNALGNIPNDILDNPSLDSLCAALTATPYTFLHIVCHGEVSEHGETILHFPKDERRGSTLASDFLNQLASIAKLPHFVFLSACNSALPRNGLGSLAQRIVRELGLPAVLAMTDRVSIPTASAITAPFYAQLYQHGQPDLALSQSLAGLQGAHDFTVPALLSRLGNRPLFDDNTDRDLTEKELEFGLEKLAEALPDRAPVLMARFDKLADLLRSTLGTDIQSLSDSRRTERKETLEQLNSLSLEALDLSFNALSLGQTPPTYDSRSPFRGLESFRPEDAAYFFGRETLTRRLVEKLNEHNFLAVLGASGSGKSSLVMAGLIPALDVPHEIFRPGIEPLVELKKALQSDPVLIVVDQFEELYTYSTKEQDNQVSEFIEQLLYQSKMRSIVIVLRSDFLGEIAPFKSLKDEVENHQAIISPMDETELRRAMESQAAVARLRFEADLSLQMLDEVKNEPGAMPLLQHALWMLWMRRHGYWLRAEEYRAFGGVKEAIASTAEMVYGQCNELEKEQIKNIFIRLTRLDPGIEKRDTRQRVFIQDLVPKESDFADIATTLKSLSDARLIVRNGDQIEIAHEAIIHHWKRLHSWITGDRSNLLMREKIGDDARHWEISERDDALLNHRGERLEQALELRTNPLYFLNSTEQTYLDACVELKDREIATAIRRKRFLILGIFTVLFVIMAILAAWAWTSADTVRQLGYQAATAEAANIVAEEQSQIALARQLAAQAEQVNQNNQQELALLLSINAMQISPVIEAAQILQNHTSTNPVTRMLHNSGVSSISFSPDGKYVASSSYDNTARIWDTTTGSEVAKLLHDNLVDDIAFSPDGMKVVSGSTDNTVRIWETSTGKELLRMTHDSWVLSVNFSPDGKYVVSGTYNGSVYIWDAITGSEFVRMDDEVVVNCVEFSPDGKYVVSNGGNTARVWDMATGREVARMKHDYSVTSVAFSPDGEYVISGGGDGTARVWESLTGKEIARMTFKGSLDQISDVHSVAFSPDGKFVASGSGMYDNTARVWDITTGREIARMAHSGGLNSVKSIAFSPDGKYVISGSSDKTARVWDANTGKEIARMTHDDIVNSVAFSPDGKYVASGSDDGTVRIWSAKKRNEMSIMAHGDEINSFTFSPDGKYLLSGSNDRTARIWEMATGREVARMEHFFWVASVAFSPNGKYVVSGNDDNTVYVWDATTGYEITHMTHDDNVTSVAISPDSKYIASGSYDKTARIWDAVKSKEIIRITYKNWVNFVIFSPDGKYVASSVQGDAIRVWETLTGNEITVIPHKGRAHLVFSPNGKYIASGYSDNTVHVWDAITGKEISHMSHDNILPTSTGTINSVSFSPDGKYVVSGSDDNTARVWDAFTGSEIARINHEHFVNSVIFSPDGRYVASSSNDETVRVWESFTGNEIARMYHTTDVYRAIFSPDGKYIVSSSCEDVGIYCGRGLIHAWIWQPDDLIENACSYVTRNLTLNEWQKYLGDSLPYKPVCPNLSSELEATP
jgi:uncharacterized delta-60 repeat protein